MKSPILFLSLANESSDSPEKINHVEDIRLMEGIQLNVVLG